MREKITSLPRKIRREREKGICVGYFINSVNFGTRGDEERFFILTPKCDGNEEERIANEEEC